ncbi:MAG: retropepsin-like domain-containing protein [Clostridiales bacterium]|nr:retropepsin-like domain-containing protein [Clostridiales bacterium]
MDKVDQIGITIEENDAIETISGVGEAEFVYQKNVDCIKFGDIEVRDFIIEVGVMDYGFNLNGIIGMDF